MLANEQKKKAAEFKEFWKGKGYEKGQSQSFWMSLLSQVFGVGEPEKFITFEDQVKLDSTSFIDGFIRETHVLIEQKSLGKDLRKPIKQSDGTLLSPFQQAKRYAAELPYSIRPRWIVTCNFSEFLVYDMEKPNAEPEEILLENLEKEYYRLDFLVDQKNEHLKKEMEVSIKAGELVGELYDKIHALYKEPENEDSLKSLNMLCVRIVFCLYAEDAGIFGKRNMFHDYLANMQTEDIRKPLIELFQVLDTKIEDRDPYLEDELAQFPYVNGGLFENENIEIPKLTLEVKELLLSQASDNFDWSEISPTIFGAVFESTLNPETRRKGGMHYTSIENIHKLIDPLFLDGLKEELEEIKQLKTLKTRNERLIAFQTKIAQLKFLDPACGSGNFLTETYVSLRKLENQILECLLGDQIVFGDEINNPIKVSIHQFYGIEINDFATIVGKTALWIAESQMLKATEDILHMNLEFLPLKSYANIVEGNSLRMDWNEVISKETLSYIMGNPPFIGFYLQNEDQKKDVKNITGESSLDYVTCWFFKAAKYIGKSNIECAFVSTNSISQGEQVALIWEPIIRDNNTKIKFAYTTFKWESEAKSKAAVHCVIIGFNNKIPEECTLYNGDNAKKVKNISPYLYEGETVLVKNASTPLNSSGELMLGNRPLDGQKLLLTKEEYQELIENEPGAKKWIRPFLGATEFINNKERYCLWLNKITPKEITELPRVLKRVEECREIRLEAKDKQMKKLADTPMLFREMRESDKSYLVLPRVSSSNRRYMPIGYIDSKIIAGDALQMQLNASLYEFGVLISNVHNSWLRAVGGRLKSDYRYGKETVYNTFPWCNPSENQIAKIEKSAEEILKVRELYPEASLADLYGEKMYLYPQLLKAHQNNDKAVMEAYGFPVKNEFTESMCVARLMEMYKEITQEKILKE